MSYKHKYVRIHTKKRLKSEDVNLNSYLDQVNMEYDLIVKEEYKLVKKVMKTLSQRDQWILNHYLRKSLSYESLLKSVLLNDHTWSATDIRDALRRFRRKYEVYISMKIHDL